MTDVRKRRLALLAGVGGAFVLFLILRGRSSAPAAEELLAAEGAYPPSTIDAGTGASLDPSFVSAVEDRLSQQDLLLEGIGSQLANLPDRISESLAYNLGGTWEDGTAVFPDEGALPPASGPIDPQAAGPVYPRYVQGQGIEVSAGVFQPIVWFTGLWRRLVAEIGAGGSASGLPAPSRRTNDSGASGQAPPPAPGNRRASVFGAYRLGSFRAPSSRVSRSRAPIIPSLVYRPPQTLARPYPTSIVTPTRTTVSPGSLLASGRVRV